MAFIETADGDLVNIDQLRSIKQSTRPIDDGTPHIKTHSIHGTFADGTVIPLLDLGTADTRDASSTKSMVERHAATMVALKDHTGITAIKIADLVPISQTDGLAAVPLKEPAAPEHVAAPHRPSGIVDGLSDGDDEVVDPRMGGTVKRHKTGSAT